MTQNSPFLAERLIARLSLQRRINLERRIREHIAAAWEQFYSREYVSGQTERAVARVDTLTRMLGRLAALTA